MKTIYEKHPVTKERKAELKAKGYRIIDIEFAPKGYVSPETEAQKDELESLSAGELRELAKKRDIAVAGNASADKIREALRAE